MWVCIMVLRGAEFLFFIRGRFECPMTEPSKKNLRFPSIAYDPSRTRASLRSRLERFLPTLRPQIGRFQSERMLSDEAFLRLLTKVRIEHGGTVEEARTIYEAAADPAGPFPKLDDLIEAKWVRAVRGRIVISVDALRASKTGLAQNATAYASMQQHQYDVTYSFEKGLDPELDATMRSLERKELTLHKISSQRPGWVVARLWEELSSRAADTQAALEEWLDLRQEIGHPHIVPMEVWEQETSEQFRKAALQLLQSEPSVGWNEIIEHLARQMANLSNAEIDVARSYFLPVPPTIIGRYLWLTSNRHERAFHSVIWHFEYLLDLVGILLADVERTDIAPAPNPLFDKVMTVLEERPEPLFLFLLFLQNRPVLLADLLLRPSTSAWACLLIWRWQIRRDAWENNTLREDDDRNKSAVFADAVSVLRYQLDEKGAPPAEAAGLLAQVFQYERAIPDTSTEISEAMRQTLLEALRQGQAESIHEILKVLFASMNAEGPGTGTFDGALSLVEASHMTALVAPVPLVSAYIASMTRDDYGLSAHQITASQAGVLYDLAARAGAEIEARFLDPLEVSKRLSVRSEPDANPFMIADAVAKTLRVHTRILCRAIVAQSDQVPDVLVNALVSTVETGAINRAERNQVDAFSAHYETDFPAKQQDKPISADLGDALTKLVGVQRDNLLHAVLQIEEPMVLARLLFFTPAELRGRLQQRVMQLTPEKATGLYMFSAAQMRIDQLLDAEFSDAAAAFLGVQFRAEYLWKIPGQGIHRLRQQLRLHLLRQEWAQIQLFAMPDDVPDQEKQAVQETIEFFRALALLKSPDGDRGDAEEKFAILQRKHPHIPAYAVNLHAVRVARLSRQNIFGYLDEDQFPDAFRVIAEGEDALSSFRELSPDDEAAIRLNNVVLLLGARQPARALDVLQEIPTGRPCDTTFAYRAIALARTGQSPEAHGVLQVAELHFGKTPVLEAALRQIQSSHPYAGQVSTSSNQDIVSSIKRALLDLAQLDAGEQARVLVAGNGTVGGYLLRQVRESAAAIMELVPMMMRNLNANLKEDDVTAFLKEILSARLKHIQWSVHFQDPGGHTSLGNPGERDLTIKKDTGVLALVEAVMTRLPATNKFTLGDLKSHLQKLIAYATCPVYFHVTYEMSGDENGVIEYLRKTSKETIVDGVTFVKHEEMAFNDSGPRGFSALYQTDAGLRTIHFLVLDLHQGVPKAAAKAAAASNPRKSKGSSTKRAKMSSKITAV